MMTLTKVVLPAPLRPTRPMRRPAGRLAVAPDRISRPAIRTTILSIASMAGRIAWAGAPQSVIFETMRKTIWLIAILFLAPAIPAGADTPSKDCLAAIHDAD